ncbi:mucoidy inhibitor MuiA family protein [Mucilaginibacter pallidiroseus]|uniref:Mucoidy inhibitor MuiA family protein n=1 Tax=Mucilaginibacter pallidiroseus TaxID=2599295 RepID=A0A563U361_9SPHI|nr:DUF4139 domain-containing protein [Mucilaginibacter pallidiroseus]TWR25770.1 mucoidy inhibitor MuiA family protein [Mucilaginibacter pallidiroseus]
MKKLLFFTCLVFFAKVAAAADGQKFSSKVQRVTVFLSGAQVTRSANVSISPGTSTLVFENISPDIDVQSLQVKAAGAFTILSVKQEMNFLNEQARQTRVEGLRAQQKALRDKINMQNALMAVNAEEASMLAKNQVISGSNTNLDVLKLKQALDFQTQRLTENKRREIAINKEIETLNSEVTKYNKQIADILKGSSTATSDVLVTVSSKAALQTVFTLTYLVSHAGWYPTYDVRAKNINSPVTIAYKANVSQQCGEDWKDVKLTLSTGNPSISGSKPDLKPYYLNFGMYYSNQPISITKVSGTVTDNTEALPGVTVRVKGTSIGTTTDKDGHYTLQVPANNPVLEYRFIGYKSTELPVHGATMNVKLEEDAKQLNEVVVTGYSSLRNKSNPGSAAEIRVRGMATMSNTIPIAVNQQENQTNTEFQIDNPYTIPADGKQYLVAIDEISTNASYQYYVAPKVSTDVFLTASIIDWNKYNFLSGEANLFFEDTFIGKSLLDTHIAGDTLNLSLGTDKNIVVTRTLQTEMKDKQGLFGSSKKEIRNWLISVKNRKSQPVQLLVEDQIPVSQNSAIEVETQDVSGAEFDKGNGKVAWNLTLAPQNEKQLNLKYQVKYPKNQTVIVQ